MQDVNVVVLFDSGDEAVERLALAAAVGAVQGRALIRLRRFHGTPESREYVTPRDGDADWAHAFVVGGTTANEESRRYIGQLGERVGLHVVILECDTSDAARDEGRRAAEQAREQRRKRRADS